jgi:hypothetical protein
LLFDIRAPRALKSVSMARQRNRAVSEPGRRGADPHDFLR